MVLQSPLPLEIPISSVGEYGYILELHNNNSLKVEQATGGGTAGSTAASLAAQQQVAQQQVAQWVPLESPVVVGSTGSHPNGTAGITGISSSPVSK